MTKITYGPRRNPTTNLEFEKAKHIPKLERGETHPDYALCGKGKTERHRLTRKSKEKS